MPEKAAAVAAWAACFLVGAALAATTPAAAGDRHDHRPGTSVVLVEARVPWYRQLPWAGTGPGHYYSQHPDHIPGYPKPLTGYAVPIYDTGRPVVHVVRRYRAGLSAHAEWCAARYRSYDVASDTFQPYRGPRRYCRSPYG